MTPEIRRAALRMAAKAALILSIEGCSGGAATAPPPASAMPPPAAAPAPTCAQRLDALKVAKPDELAADDPLRGKQGVYGAFADVAARRDPQTQQCCHAELEATGGQSAHRWECCSALDTTTGLACTPWGPPCPPEMDVA